MGNTKLEIGYECRFFEYKLRSPEATPCCYLPSTCTQHMRSTSHRARSIPLLSPQNHLNQVRPCFSYWFFIFALLRPVCTMFYTTPPPRTTVFHVLLPPLKKTQQKVDAKNESAGMTPLHLAVANGQHAAARLLVHSGANVCLPDARGLTPLRLTVEMADAPTVALLLAAEPPPDLSVEDQVHFLMILRSRDQA